MHRLLILLALAAALSAQQATGNITNNSSDCSVGASCVRLTLPAGTGSVAQNVSGTYTGTLQFEASPDGTVTTPHWVALNCYPQPTGAVVTSTTSTGTWVCNAAGFTDVRVRASAAVTGTAVVTINASAATTNTRAVPIAALPFGAANQILSTNTAGTGDEFRTLGVGTSGTDFAVAFGAGSTTFNLPDASATARGAVTTGAQIFGGAKTLTSAVMVSPAESTPTETTPTIQGVQTNNGNITVAALATPVMGVISPQTPGGGKTCTYTVVALLTDSTHTAKATPASTADCADDLTVAAHGNVVNWGIVVGETGGYDIYRTAFNGTKPAGAAAIGKIAHVATGLITYTDPGANGDAAAAPTTDTTGSVGVGIAPGTSVFYVQKNENATSTAHFENTDTTDTLSRFSLTVRGGNTIGELKTINGDDFYVGTQTAVGNVALQTNGTARWRVQTAGHLVAGVDNTYDIGATATTLRPRNLFLAGRIGSTIAGTTTGLVGAPVNAGTATTAGFSTTQSNVSILAASYVSDQEYRIGYTVFESANGSGGTCNTNATVTPAITYTDPNNQTHVFTAGAISLKPTADAGTEGLNCAAAVGSGGCEIRRNVKGGTAITITYTFGNGNCNTQPQATAKASAEVVN